MSNLYGNQMIPSDVSSLYFYDKTYESSVNLDDMATSDGVFIGRYILVKGDGDNRQTHSKAYRKVVQGDKMAYEEVAVLDGATPSISVSNVGYGETYFDANNVFNEKEEKGTNSIYINEGTYTDDGTYAMKLNVELPIMGEAVGQVYNVLYGSNTATRKDNVGNASSLMSNTSMNGKTLADDGLIGLLASIDWNSLGKINEATYANKYLGLTSEPKSTIDTEYVKCAGGKLTGSLSIELPAATGSAERELTLGGYIAFHPDDITFKKPLAMGTNTITSNPSFSSISNTVIDTVVPNYGMIKRIVDTSGNAYVLKSDDYEVNNGTVTLKSYADAPQGTIFFIPVSS